jgi:hypothetical protein
MVTFCGRLDAGYVRVHPAQGNQKRKRLLTLGGKDAARGSAAARTIAYARIECA